jgi:WD40 repeat protein
MNSELETEETADIGLFCGPGDPIDKSIEPIHTPALVLADTKEIAVEGLVVEQHEQVQDHDVLPLSKYRFQEALPDNIESDVDPHPLNKNCGQSNSGIIHVTNFDSIVPNEQFVEDESFERFSKTTGAVSSTSESLDDPKDCDSPCTPPIVSLSEQNAIERPNFSLLVVPQTEDSELPRNNLLEPEIQRHFDNFEISSPESERRKSPNKSRRNSHLVVENDDTGEGLNVVAISKLPLRSASSPLSERRKKPDLPESFRNSLLDDEQSFGSEQHRSFKDFVTQQEGIEQRIQHKSTAEESWSSRTVRPLIPREPLSSSAGIPAEVQSEITALSEEKKDHSEIGQPNRREFANQRHARFAIRSQEEASELRDCISATESEVASLDGLPPNLQDRLLQLGTSPREKILQNLDGIFSHTRKRNKESSSARTSEVPRRVVIDGGMVYQEKPNDSNEDENAATCGGIFIDTCVNFSGIWGGNNMEDGPLKCGSKGQWDTSHMKEKLEIPLAILDCANIINQDDRIPTPAPRVHSSYVRVAGDHTHSSYSGTIFSTEADPRMQDWISNHYAVRDRPPIDGSYHLGQSRTVIVHEINRGDWTWCTAWSPDGTFLAIATENHHLAVVDPASSTVWKVKHDRRMKASEGSNTTRSIRSIAWGSNYIAIGGTGNVVSILSPVEPFDSLHDIQSTGFVGSLHWRGESNVLAIGSRLDLVLIVRIVEIADHNVKTRNGKQLRSDILHKIEFKYWVNCVKFNVDGCFLAVGDAGGIVSVYDYNEASQGCETNMITFFKRKDSILSIAWSPDGKWLYAGGEDCSVTVVDTTYWEIVHRIGQDRWVQCIASSHGGSHVAIGGVSSEISILDVENGWDSVMGIALKGLVPLSAQWHPRDQYLVLTGQDNSILAVETTNARHIKGHYLHSISPVRAIEFSPDGRTAIIGNDAGVVTFFSLSETSFITAYELVIPLHKSTSIRWSLNGLFIVVGSMSSVIIVSRKRNKRQEQKCAPNASGFSVKKVITDVGAVHAISIDFQSQFVAVSGDCTRILDVQDGFAIVQELKNGPYYANAWSPDGRWLAMMGKEKYLTIYDTSSKQVNQWRAIFSMKCDFIGRALAWGSLIIGGLLYLAYGGDSNEIYIMEIRTHEGTWETVLKVRRDASINTLDWSIEGLLAAGVGNGTVCIIDLVYLQSGVAVSEMDNNWQRQALTCFTEIRRNRGANSIKSLRWLPAAPGSDRLLAVGGTDGEVEIIDLTERRQCKGYS